MKHGGHIDAGQNVVDHDDSVVKDQYRWFVMIRRKATWLLTQRGTLPSRVQCHLLAGIDAVVTGMLASGVSHQALIDALRWSDADSPPELELYFLAGAAGGALTLLESQARPSRRPSPVVAQLGTTYHTLSLSLDSCSTSVTSWGFMARYCQQLLVLGRLAAHADNPWQVTYLRSDPACWQRLITGCPSSRGR